MHLKSLPKLTRVRRSRPSRVDTSSDCLVLCCNPPSLASSYQPMQVCFSIIIPVYRNEENLPDLLARLSNLHQSLGESLEVIFVVDGSPDRSFEILKRELLDAEFPSQLIGHSRNFGSFAAIRTGMGAAHGEFLAVMAADLQEPAELYERFLTTLQKGDDDVLVAARRTRRDPLLSRLGSGIFWWSYRKWVIPEIPEGGVDVFACNRAFRDALLKMNESRSSLVGLIFWLGFRRSVLFYDRQEREAGQSAWGLRRKLDYMLDSMFAFTDRPIRVLLEFGLVALLLSGLLALLTVTARLLGLIEVPGYTATILTLLFFGSLNVFCLGIVGSYTWRAYENTKARPQAVSAVHLRYPEQTESTRPSKSNSRHGARTDER